MKSLCTIKILPALSYFTVFFLLIVEDKNNQLSLDLFFKQSLGCLRNLLFFSTVAAVSAGQLDLLLAASVLSTNLQLF